MTYTPVSIPKTNNGGRTKPKDAEIIIGRFKDVKSWPEPDAKGVVITEDIELNTGANVITIECTASTIAVSQTTEGDPDNKGVKQKLEFERPGTGDVDFEEFCENNVNEDLFAIVRYISGNVNKLFGYKGNPLQMVSETTDNNEGDKTKITLESVLRGRRIAIYQGQLPAIQGADDDGTV
ncbi:MAG: hypothetical protein J6K74_07800 [Marinifilaceae bacterium]|nr:hypothetical protein [Marinifilaceae bacterium]